MNNIVWVDTSLINEHSSCVHIDYLLIFLFRACLILQSCSLDHNFVLFNVQTCFWLLNSLIHFFCSYLLFLSVLRSIISFILVPVLSPSLAFTRMMINFRLRTETHYHALECAIFSNSSTNTLVSLLMLFCKCVWNQNISNNPCFPSLYRHTIPKIR